MRPGDTPQGGPNVRADYTVMHALSPARPGPGGRAGPLPPMRSADTPLMHRLWWMIPLLAMLGAAAAWVVVDSRPPEYQARARLLVGDTLSDFDHIRAAEALTATYAELANSRSILDAAALGLTGDVDDLVDDVSTVAVGNSRVLLVTVTATTPTAARHMANGVANALVEFRAPPRRQIALIDEAGPAERVPDRAIVLVALGATAGALAAAGAILALDPWVQRRRRGSGAG